MGPEAPSPSWLKDKILKMFFIIKGRRTSSNVLEKLCEEDLKFFRAYPEKRLKILNILEDMVEHSDSLKNDKNSKLHIELAVRIADWESNQRDSRTYHETFSSFILGRAYL